MIDETLLPIQHYVIHDNDCALEGRWIGAYADDCTCGLTTALRHTPATADNALADEIEQFEGSDALGNGDFSVCHRAATALRASPPREQWQDISTVEQASKDIWRSFKRAFWKDAGPEYDEIGEKIAVPHLTAFREQWEQAHNEKIAENDAVERLLMHFDARGYHVVRSDLPPGHQTEAVAILRRDYAQEQGT